MIKLCVKDLLRNTNAKLLNGNENETINDCFINSKEITKGSCFFGIKGSKEDGSLYYKEALDKGASVLVLTKKNDYDFNGYEDRTIIIANDTKEVLQDLAKYKRSLFKGTVIGITGSVGKTTTKQMISSILKQQYSLVNTVNNMNGQIGLPLTILSLKDENVMVLEMGISMPGEMKILSEIAKPDIVVITNVYESHIANYSSKEEIIKEKLGIISTNTRKIVINNDNLRIQEEIDKEIITFGILKNSSYQALNITDNFDISFDCGEIKNIKIKGSKDYVYNALAAIAVSKIMNIENETIKLGLCNMVNESHRLQRIKCNDFLIIDDTYNASYESILNAISYLDNYNNRKILVLGDILEIGNNYKEVYKNISNVINKSNIELLITIGDKSKYINKSIKNIKNKHFKRENESRKYLKKHIRKNDVILLKASHAVNLIDTVNYLKTI